MTNSMPPNSGGSGGSAPKNFSHQVNSVTIQDPGKSLGLAGNVSYGASRGLFYIKNIPLLLARGGGVIGFGLFGVFSLAFLFNLFFPGNGLSRALTNAPGRVLEASSDTVRGIVTSGADAGSGIIQPVIEPEQAAPSNMPNGITTPQ